MDRNLPVAFGWQGALLGMSSTARVDVGPAFVVTQRVWQAAWLLFPVADTSHNRRHEADPPHGLHR